MTVNRSSFLGGVMRLLSALPDRCPLPSVLSVYVLFLQRAMACILYINRYFLCLHAHYKTCFRDRPTKPNRWLGCFFNMPLIWLVLVLLSKNLLTVSRGMEKTMLVRPYSFFVFSMVHQKKLNSCCSLFVRFAAAREKILEAPSGQCTGTAFASLSVHV